jgi:hypothetical protein
VENQEEIFKELKEIGIGEEELVYALKKAKGIIYGYAMEYKAVKLLMDMGFKEVKLVDMPTHDIEAEKENKTFFIEVKASKRSPTKNYSAHKLAMMASLKGNHLTLIMGDNVRLVETKEILSKPKRLLYEFLLALSNENKEEIVRMMKNQDYREVIMSYNQVIKENLIRVKDNQLREFLLSVLQLIS